MRTHVTLASTLALALIAAPSVAADPEPAPPERTNTAEKREARILPRAGGWTADTAASRAKDTSFDVAAKRAAIEAAAAKADQALLQFMPRLAGTARYTRLSSITPPGGFTMVSALGPDGRPVPPGPVAPGSTLVAAGFRFPVVLDNWLFQASLTVPLSDYLFRASPALTAASRGEDAARLERIATEAKVKADAKVAFYDWVKALGQREVLAQQLEVAGERKRDAEALFKVGKASKADVLAADAALAQGKLAEDQAEELVGLAEAQLRALTQAPDTERIGLGEDVTVPLPPLPVDLAALRQEAVASRPDLRALGASEEALVKSARAVRASQLPRLDAFGDLIHSNPNQRYQPAVKKFHTTWDVGLQVTWSPNDAFSGRAQGAELEANAAKLRAERSRARDAVMVEVTRAALAVRTADASVESTSLGIAAATEAHRVRRELYRAGQATGVELSDAEASLFRAKLSAVAARIDQRVSRVRLDHATGRDTK
ncbi:MAG: TolC family protein [Polyangiaceae bacterium]|nr:TolC family protein [Polyangiaceae bacterium]